MKSNIYHCNLIFHFETPEIIRIILIYLPSQHDLGFYLMCNEKKMGSAEANGTKTLRVEAEYAT